MIYLCVKWNHSFPDMPVLLYCELNDQRWETRKVDIFRDGSKGYASADSSAGDTGLGELPTPSHEEIVSNPVFEPTEITQQEFDEVWNDRFK